MPHDIHAPMNRARDLYIEARTYAERNAAEVALNALRSVPARSREHAGQYQTAQRWYDDAAKALGAAEHAAGDYFDEQICLSFGKS